MYRRSAVAVVRQISNARAFSVLAPLKAKTIDVETVDTLSSSGTTTATANESSLTSSSSSSSSSGKLEPLSDAQRAYLDRAIRVDQAGELGADYIYRGQIFVLGNSHPELRPVLNHMWEQEVHHRNTFNELQLKHRIRPSLLTPVWKLGAIALGVLPAMISPAAAMATTEAVETVIGGHYNEQLRCLTTQYELHSTDGTRRPPEEITELTKTIKQFRDDELEHLDTAVEHDAHMAVPYMLLTETIKGICRVAVWTAERI